MKKGLVIFGLSVVVLAQVIYSSVVAIAVNNSRIERSSFEKLQGSGRLFLAEVPFLINELDCWLDYYKSRAYVAKKGCMPYELGMILLRFETYFNSPPQAVFRAILATKFESEAEYQKAEKWLSDVRVETWSILQKESNVVINAIDNDVEAFNDFLAQEKLMPSCSSEIFLIAYKDYLARKSAAF